MVEREDVQAAIETRAELGKEMEPQVVDAFLERIEKQIEKRTPTEHRSVTPLALGSLFAGVAATGAAVGPTDGSAGGVVVAIIAWIAIAIVNLAYARRL
jgi:Flp pilus assembly protein TadB